MNKATIRGYLNKLMTIKDTVPILVTTSRFPVEVEGNPSWVFVKLANMDFKKIHISIEHCVTYFEDSMTEFQIRKIRARSLHRLYSDKRTNRFTQVVMITICDRALWELKNA